MQLSRARGFWYCGDMAAIGSDFPFEYDARRWRARWIGSAQEAVPGSHALFRLRFELSQAGLEVGGLALAISAEREYHLYVNGLFVSRGVPPSPYYYKFYDELEITEHLRLGANCIAVLVSSIGAPRAGLLAELWDAEGTLVLATDSTWRVTTADGRGRVPVDADGETRGAAVG